MHNYKSLWPKQLFIYAHRNDHPNYHHYVSMLRRNSFDNTHFITHIEDYLAYLPQKEDVSYSVLMGEYSGANLRKFFKGADEILLLCENAYECMPLLRGKVSFVTTEIECMDRLLA